MRKKLIRTCCHASLSLVMANLIPIVYVLVHPAETSYGMLLYLKSLLIFFPAAATDYAIRRAKTLTAYLLSCAAVLTATGASAWLLGPVPGRNSGFGAYPLFILGETLFLVTGHYSVHRQKQEEYLSFRAGEGEGEAMSFAEFIREGEPVLDKPQMSFLLVFAGTYALGLLFHHPVLCNIALWGVTGYLFLLLFYTYLQKTENYLSLHKRVKGVPRMRIYGIGRTMFLLLSACLLVGIIPGFLTAKYRNYFHLQEWSIPLEREAPDMQPEVGTEWEEPWMPDYRELAYKEPPWWLDGFTYAVTAILYLSLAFFAGKAIRRAFLDFRSGSEENEDIVENLKDEPEEKIQSLFSKRKGNYSKEAWSVRREYRRMIRRSRRDIPKPWETPAEIEAKAGLGQDDHMQKLHRQYEEVRYTNF